MKPHIKTLTVKNLTLFLLYAGILTLIIFAISFRSLSQSTLEDKALALSETIKAGLTSHMKAGIMDKRDYFIDEIKSIHDVQKIEIIRSPELIKQYGKGLKQESLGNSLNSQVFETKQPFFSLDEFSRQPKITAIIPYIATNEGKLSCLQCHHVPEGTPLGAVSIELDVTEYRNLSFIVMGGIMILLIFFIYLIILNNNSTISTHVQKPLETLINKARRAYEKNIPVNPKNFASIEFEQVAKEFNLFNQEVLANEQLLRNKNQELKGLNEEIETTLKETIFTMGVIEEERSKETKNHTKRVTLYSRLLAEKMGLDEELVEMIETASPLHDIGKIGIPDAILFKPDKLDDDEYTTMQKHTLIGYSMLKHSQRQALKIAAIIAYQHHEKWDGSGYPQGLSGEEIDICGRIVALADVFDALSCKRVYKDSWTSKEVVDFIVSEKGKHFDPQLVDIFLENQSSFCEIRDQYPS